MRAFQVTDYLKEEDKIVNIDCLNESLIPNYVKIPLLSEKAETLTLDGRK